MVALQVRTTMGNLLAGLHLEDVEPIFRGMLIFFLVRSKAARQFAFLLALLCVRLSCSLICLPLLYFCGRGIEKHLAYQMYFYVYWTSYALEAILSLLVIYSIFRLAMAPLKGLQTLGMLVFRWGAAISVALAIRVAISPHESGVAFMTSIATLLQHSSSIPSRSFLLFDSFGIRPRSCSCPHSFFAI